MTTTHCHQSQDRVGARPRAVERVVAGQPTSDGAGVKLTRVLTQPLQRRLDPFLMLDAFGTDDPQDYIGGFPDHPHRGFETVTYMIAGRMRHRDSAGHEGLLSNGGVQWMTAGRGVIHSELPEQEDGRMEGFQLWLNLAGEGQDARSVVSRHPERGDPGVHDRRRRESARRSPAAAMASTARCSARSPNRFISISRFRRERASRRCCRRRTTRSSTSIAARLQIDGTQVPAQRMAILANDARHRRRRARGDRADARAADRRKAAARADRAVRTVRDEHERRDLPGGEGLSVREIRDGVVPFGVTSGSERREL